MIRPVHTKILSPLFCPQLGLTSRPMPLGAPPRDVVQEILHRAHANEPQEDHRHDEHAMREVIAIAQTGDPLTHTGVERDVAPLVKLRRNSK
jgi:hypothetical protein